MKILIKKTTGTDCSNLNFLVRSGTFGTLALGEPVGAHSGPHRRPRGGGAAARLGLKGTIGGRGRLGPPTPSRVGRGGESSDLREALHESLILVRSGQSVACALAKPMLLAEDAFKFRKARFSL